MEQAVSTLNLKYVYNHGRQIAGNSYYEYLPDNVIKITHHYKSPISWINVDHNKMKARMNDLAPFYTALANMINLLFISGDNGDVLELSKKYPMIKNEIVSEFYDPQLLWYTVGNHIKNRLPIENKIYIPQEICTTRVVFDYYYTFKNGIYIISNELDDWIKDINPKYTSASSDFCLVYYNNRDKFGELTVEYCPGWILFYTEDLSKYGEIPLDSNIGFYDNIATYIKVYNRFKIGSWLKNICCNFIIGSYTRLIYEPLIDFIIGMGFGHVKDSDGNMIPIRSIVIPKKINVTLCDICEVDGGWLVSPKPLLKSACS